MSSATETPDRVLRRLLDHFEARLDLGHVAEVRHRHRAVLDFESVDRLPLVFYLPYEGEEFARYPFAEAFEDPAKLMVNELLAGFTSPYHALELKDDAPLCLRPNLGTGIVASMFGSNIRLMGDDPPWAEALDGIEALEAVAEAELPDVRAGLGQRVLDQYAYFDEALRDYPTCRAAFQITLPDLQGPFSTVELLWGSSIYVNLYDRPELVRTLMDRVARQMIEAYRAFGMHVREDLGDGYCYQHNVGVKGRLLVRDDSMILVSPEMYAELVLPYDRMVAEAVGGAGFHFCGKGEHQVDNLLSIPGCTAVDLGQPELNDVAAIHGKTAERGVALTRIEVPAGELDAERLVERFGTGVVLVQHVQSLAHAHHLRAQYDSQTCL